MKLLLINTVLNYGSTGRIVEQIGFMAVSHGWECQAAHGVKYSKSSSLSEIVVGSFQDVLCHEFASYLWDSNGLASRNATKRLIEKIKVFSPDIIHLHNLHGYYINYPLLFRYLSTIDIPVVWTFHDCWPITGHCSHFDFLGCDRWKTGCGKCPGLSVYPRSLFVDRSSRNYILKKECFTAIADRLTIVAVSDWLASAVRQSFLKEADIRTIHNGVDIHCFRPRETSVLKDKLQIGSKRVILGVASPWTVRKGLDDMIQLASLLPSEEYQVILVGLSDKQIGQMPENIIGIKRTNNVSELAELYSLASVFVNTTYEDSFPTVNLEALACGTPVVTYNTGGGPEAIDDNTGLVVPKGSLEGLVRAIIQLPNLNSDFTTSCRERAVSFFNKDDRFVEYYNLYKSLLSNSK